MTLVGYEVFAINGFMIAAYAIVANNAIQTPGTFPASNPKRSWVTLCLFASATILSVMAYGWFAYDGDIAFDQLNQNAHPDDGLQFWHALPPLVLLILKRFGGQCHRRYHLASSGAGTGARLYGGISALRRNTA